MQSGEEKRHANSELHEVESVSSAPANGLAVAAVFVCHSRVWNPVAVLPRTLTLTDSLLVHSLLHHLQTLYVSLSQQRLVYKT